jgi:pyruvate carboxylase
MVSLARRFNKLLIANRGEIACRIIRTAKSMGLRTVAVFSEADRNALHVTLADESVLIGPATAKDSYLRIGAIIDAARETGAEAVHPGYGFLSENADFAQAVIDAGLIWIGPNPDSIRAMGLKDAAKKLMAEAGVPTTPGYLGEDQDEATLHAEADRIGYPVMIKAVAGGGGRGMRLVENPGDFAGLLDSAQREAKSAFGNPDVLVEKFVVAPRHIEVQVFGDNHGNVVHLFERDCSVQRRNQKVVERAPAPYLSSEQRAELCESALKLCRAVNYTHAGTVEFLMDADSSQFFFIEVNPRIQVEHTVTEMVTGIDIVKAQIRVTEGARIGDADSGVPAQADIRLNGHALQCRITTEDPEKNFTPDYGRLTAYRSAAGFGVRLDAGTAYANAVITPYYDSLLVKVTAWAPTSDEAISRMNRALREFRIRGVSTNLPFLENVISHPLFRSGECTTRFIDTTPELFKFHARRDRATKLLRFIGEVIVNGNPEMKGRKRPDGPIPHPAMPKNDMKPLQEGARAVLLSRGPEGFARWMTQQKRVLLTDTTMRDAHQSLLATRVRTRDIVEIAPYYARMLPNLFSLECWGGATFDVALRFLKEDPWERLASLRARIPNIPLQMLLRSSNAVGYTNYADNVVRFFTRQAARSGIDIFRVFDSLNWVENMRVAIDAVLETNAVCEAAMCYTADIFDTSRPKYNLQYYVKMAKELERTGAHVLGIKDMAGVCKPRAARELVRALKQEVGMPIHFHTHDTSGISAASVLAAVEAGAEAVDGAMDSMSGLTSQPNLTAIAAALVGSERDPCMDVAAMQAISHYWEGVRRYYAPFEADIRSGTADVYQHEMPGGQYTNLREQARSMGLDHRWPEVSKAYAEVNKLFGDIVKVTPSSKVVGDMAIFLVNNRMTMAQFAALPVDHFADRFARDRSERTIRVTDAQRRADQNLVR